MHPKHAEDAQYIPHPCFEREVRAAGTIPSVVSNAQYIISEIPINEILLMTDL